MQEPDVTNWSGGLGILIYLPRYLDQETAKEPFRSSS